MDGFEIYQEILSNFPLLNLSKRNNEFDLIDRRKLKTKRLRIVDSL